MPKDTFCEAVGCVWSSFTLPLWCSDLCHFDVLYWSLVFSHLWNICGSLLLEYASLPLEATQMEISSFDCTPTFVFPPSSCTHTDFLPTPRMHMPFHMAFLLQALFPFSEMTGRPPCSFVMGSLFLSTGSGLCIALPMAVTSLFPCLSPKDHRACSESAPSAPVLSGAWNGQCTQPIHTEWMNEHKGQGFLCVFFAETLKLYCTVYKMPCPSFSFLSSRYVSSWLLLGLQGHFEQKYLKGLYGSCFVSSIKIRKTGFLGGLFF